MTDVEAFVTTIEQNKDANAPNSVMIRRPNCVPRTALTQVFVFGLMGFHLGLLSSRLPHYRVLESIQRSSNSIYRKESLYVLYRDVC